MNTGCGQVCSNKNGIGGAAFALVLFILLAIIVSVIV